MNFVRETLADPDLALLDDIHLFALFPLAANDRTGGIGLCEALEELVWHGRDQL